MPGDRGDAVIVLVVVEHRNTAGFGGSGDEQVGMADAQRLFDSIGARDKTFRIFTPEEGGAQHCQRDYLTLVVADMWNWFEEKLVRA